MLDKFQGKYRITSIRLPNWDYGWNGIYFVTICTQNRHHFFGEIQNGKMILSDIGEIVKNEWLKTFEIRTDMNLKMGEYVVMPDHFHCIIMIGENQYNKRNRNAPYCRDAMHRVPTMTTASVEINTNTPKNKFGPQLKNLPSIIRGFKSAVTIRARRIDPGFGWQSRYYERIIRNEKSYRHTVRYIQNNPMNWNGK